MFSVAGAAAITRSAIDLHQGMREACILEPNNYAYCTGPKKAPKRQFFCIFSNIWPLARPNIAREKPWLPKTYWREGCVGLRRENFEILDIQKVETPILGQKGKKLIFFAIFSAVFPNIWPLAGPNIAKKGGPLRKLARGDRQTHFGTFSFWVKPGCLWFQV